MNPFRTPLTRREALKVGAAAMLTGCIDPSVALGDGVIRTSGVIEKRIPSSGETIPVVGIGTARRYDVGDSGAERAPLREVLRRFPQLGGEVIDTAPAYGNAEIVVGDLVNELGIRDELFLATKVSIRDTETREDGIQQMERSLQRLHTDHVDLMQVHNLRGVETLLPLIYEWKSQGRIRYAGISTSSERQYDDFVKVMRREPLDFIQVDYSIDNRSAADRILPLAADRGMAVLVNLPFGRTRVFQNVQHVALPDWAAEIDATSWAQVFLKYIVSHPSVTCAIPGTARPEYVVDNMAAARGELPDAAMRRRIETFFDALAES